jgi:DNA repair protein RecO (recombination protein O)
LAGPGHPVQLAGPAVGLDRQALRSFSIPGGGLTCHNCRGAGAATPAAGTIELMTALLQGNWSRADGSERRYQSECSGLVAAYTQWHLEHTIRSLRHVEHA